MKYKKWCTVPECSYPMGQCSGACFHPEERQMTMRFDEARIDVIGQNGGDGEHYSDCPPAVPTLPTPLPTPDMVNHPPHYTQGGIECIDAMQAALSPEQFKGYLKGAAFKYLWRLDHKDEAKENAEKAIWYMQRLVKVLS